VDAADDVDGVGVDWLPTFDDDPGRTMMSTIMAITATTPSRTSTRRRQ
jgi:hypothetical protein